jgi:hypothetical protein
MFLKISYSAYLSSLAVPIAIVAAQQGNNNGNDGDFFKRNRLINETFK